MAQAVALWTGVAAGAGVAASVSASLAQDMVSQGLTTGFIGVRYAYEALALNGHIEAALRTLLRTSYPSYGEQSRTRPRNRARARLRSEVSDSPAP